MSRGFVSSTWYHQTFWRHGGGLPCSRPWLPTRSCYDVWRWCLWPDSNNAIQESSIWVGRQTSPQGGTRFRMVRAQFWTLAQSKYISEGTQKWTLLGSKVVPPGGPVFGPFILSDVLKVCKLLCAQNVKFEATLTQTASVAGILNWGGPGCQLVVAMMCDADVCGLIPTTQFKRVVFEWGVKQAPREAPDSEWWGPSFGPLRKANIFQKGPKSGPS